MKKTKHTPTPWESVGIDQMTYAKLSWPEKKIILRAHGYKFLPFWKKQWRNFLIWRNRPTVGYLFKAWRQDNAEKETIKWKYGKRVSYLDYGISCRGASHYRRHRVTSGN